MNNIRVTHSGFIAFFVGLGSIFTGILFTLIVTRQLSPEEFGIWTIIGSMVGYFLISEPIISYWTTRQIARDEPVGKTSLVSSIIFASGSLPMCIVFVYLFAHVEPEFFNTMLLAVILVPIVFVSQTLTGINLGHKPHSMGIEVLIFESLKVPAGLGLVYFLNLGIEGAIIAVTIAYAGKIIIQLRYAKQKLFVRINFIYLKNWIKQSWIPMYWSASNIIWTFDVLVFTIIIGSVVGVAYYAAALTITNVIAHAGKISQALYPKLLAKGDHAYISENFTRMLYFAIPLLFITIVFSKHALFVLNPEYTPAVLIVIMLAFRTFFYVINSVFHQILMGIESIDTQVNLNTSKLFKSKLFLVNTILNIHSISYIAILSISLYIFKNLTELELVMIWSIILTALSIPYLIYSGLLVKKYATLNIQYKDIFKYLCGGVGIIAIFLLTNEHIIPAEDSIFIYLPQLFLELVLCSAVYLGITYAIDHKTRTLFSSILSEIGRVKK